MVSAIDSGSSAELGRCVVFCSRQETVRLSTQEYKWEPANFQGNRTRQGNLTKMSGCFL